MQKKSYHKDILPSLVVFLVALPLCMGIAIASGVPAEKGLITGIIGGLIVGSISGCPLQVSGPAAGLIVIVWDIVQKFGIEGLGVAVFLGGVLQLIAGFLGLAQWFRAVSPAVIRGMLSGIGVIILASQFHIMIDDTPKGSVIENITSLPAALVKIFDPALSSSHTAAALIGLFTILVLYAWERLKPQKLRYIPGALVAVISGSIAAYFSAASISFIQIPRSFISSLATVPWFDFDFQPIMSSTFFSLTFALAIVASAETLLCAVAVDKMHRGPKTRFDKELISQGIGNLLCGFFAALPMTGVIVRSSANVNAGATTRASSIMHGAWLLLLIACFPGLLNLIPTASLASLLVYIGYKLIDIPAIKEIKKQSKQEFITFLVTIGGIVLFDLLTGIALGVIFAVFQLALKMNQLQIHMSNEGKEYYMEIEGAATFLKLPALARTLESLPDDAILHVRLSKLTYIDRACLELLIEWEDQHESMGGQVLMEWDELHSKHNVANPWENYTPTNSEPIVAKPGIRMNQ